MRCGVLAVVAAAALAVFAARAVGDAPCVALAPIPNVEIPRRRTTRRGEHPYLALVATTWGECSAAIIARIVLLGASSCMPSGYLHNGRVEAGNNRFFSAQDFGEEPTQAKIIDRFMSIGPKTPFADSLMLIKLLDPFQFTSYVKSIHISPAVSLPVGALVVGYGLGGEQPAHRVQTSVGVLLDQCCDQPPRGDALCVVKATNDCRPDHGAVLVAEGKLVAIASNQSLCDGTVLFVSPLRDLIWRKAKILESGGRKPTGCGGPCGCGSGSGSGSKSAAGARRHRHGSLLMRWAVATVPALLAWALA